MTRMRYNKDIPSEQLAVGLNRCCLERHISWDAPVNPEHSLLFAKVLSGIKEKNKHIHVEHTSNKRETCLIKKSAGLERTIDRDNKSSMDKTIEYKEGETNRTSYNN